MHDITVITCTHNPRPDYLTSTIAALAGQNLSRDRWEYLLIDNASAPSRAPNVDLSWHPQARTIREDKLGLTPARLRGIQEAQGELLVFVDDDNVLDTNFLEQALKVAKEKSFLGSWSGQCRARFDEPPPEWTRRYWGNLVIREFDTDRWSNIPRLPETMPCGAGLCVRRLVANHYLTCHETGRTPILLDRSGDSLVSGGDNDLAACACDLGIGVGLIAALKLTHLIPPERLTLDYLVRLTEGIYFSGAILDAARGVVPKPLTLERKLFNYLRLVWQPFEHRAILKAAERGRSKAWRIIKSQI